MKTLIVFLLSLFLILPGFSQFNDQSTDQKCSRYRNTSLKEFHGYKQSALMQDYDVRFYYLDINLERTSTYVSGHVEIVADVSAAQLDTFAVELIDELTVDSVFVNSSLRTFSHSSDHIYIPLSSPLGQGTSFNVTIYYHGNPSTGGGFFSGITNDYSPSWGNQVTWTLSEPFNANQWWPCKQDLTDKADSSWVFITTSSENMAGSNGLLTAVVPLTGSKTRYEWKSKFPIDYYLISASVAKYIDYTIYAHPSGTTDSIMIQNFVYDNPATLPYWKDEIDITADFIELYSDLFGLYPFIDEKYGHCMAPLGGGMEHQTMTTLGSFGYYLVCHELAHQWFGDNVTCATWSDIWINEGFASYGEYLTAQYNDSYAEAQSHMADVHDNVMSQPGGSVYIPPAQTGDESRIFDGRLSYDKGSAIIHMIRFEMQDDSLFFQTLQDFQQIYADSVATGEDFKSVCENVSGKDFTDFFDQWYFGEGFPTFNVVWTQLGDTLHFTVTETTSMLVTPLFKQLVEYQVNWLGGDSSIIVYQDANVSHFAVYMPHTVTSMEIDPENWIVNGQGSVIASTEDIFSPAFFTLAPNPCRETLQLFIPYNIASDKKQLRVFDISGKLILQQSIFGDTKLDVSTLQAGLYLISISTDQDNYHSRFVKQ